MPTFWDSRASALGAGSLLMVILAGLMFRVLPVGLANFLTIWTILSLPLGIAIGHCARDED